MPGEVHTLSHNLNVKHTIGNLLNNSLKGHFFIRLDIDYHAHFIEVRLCFASTLLLSQFQVKDKIFQCAPTWVRLLSPEKS